MRMKLLFFLALAVHLSLCTRAAQDPLENINSLNANSATIDRIALHTPYGRIVVKLLDDNAPLAAAAVRQHAIDKGCKECKFYRAEARPSEKKHQPKEGPPYALLQGSMNLPDIPGSEGDIEVK
jgi:Cyclophilin type peptidyl-prolyl cis-trans isomerase/CLD